MWTRSYTASWGDVYTHFLFWASFFLEYFFENPAQKRINLAFLSTFLSKFIPFEQFIPFLSTFLSTFLSNIQQKYFFEHFFEYSKKYSKCWVLFWVLFWELFWGFFWDFHYDKTYLNRGGQPLWNIIFWKTLLTSILKKYTRYSVKTTMTWNIKKLPFLHWSHPALNHCAFQQRWTTPSKIFW